MYQVLWKCPLCRATNVVGAPKCTVCRKPYAGTEETFRDARIEERIPDPVEDLYARDQRLFQDLNDRIERASVEIMKESIPPKAAVRLVVPAGPLGWVTVAIVVIALATTLAILKSLF